MSAITPIKVYAFEIIERVVRFYTHLDLIDDEFYNQKQYADKQRLIQKYKGCLLELLKGGIILVNSSDSEQQNCFIIAKKTMDAIVNLHVNYLYFLPRPSEPVELRRFTRIIDSKQNSDQKVSIFPSEKIGEETFFKSLLHQFINEELHSFSSLINKCGIKNDISENVEHSESSEKSLRNITIPRIDMRNPCRWATILHEIGHHQIDEYDQDIFDQFKIFINNTPEHKELYERVIGDDSEKVEIWLREIWCDLYAAISIGPAIWFSQFIAFLFADSKHPITEESHPDKYPPAFIRLELIYAILCHRFPEIQNNTQIEILVNQYEGLLDKIYLNRDITKSKEQQNFIYVLRNFFLSDFDDPRSVTIREGLTKGVEFIPSNMDKITKMVGQLSQGVPVPSIPPEDIRMEKECVSDVSSILLAAWFYRCGEFRDEIITVIANHDNKSSLEDLLAFKLMPLFDRFDNSVLRSIQVSEWLNLYQSDENNYDSGVTKNSPNLKIKHTGLMVDHEILNSITQNELVIIPIINLKNQLGAASFDVRLGTSFEIFFPNEYGVIDFTGINDTRRTAIQSN